MPARAWTITAKTALRNSSDTSYYWLFFMGAGDNRHECSAWYALAQLNPRNHTNMQPS